MPIDPQAQAILEEMAAAGGPPIHTLSVAAVRESIKAVTALAGDPEPVSYVKNRLIPGPADWIPVRIYIPEGKGLFPTLVYFHGGGWVIGDLDTHDVLCRSLANSAKCVVVSVGYRLGPEHRFPAGVEDCYAATCWVVENATSLNADPSRIAVGGDSAGGNLAAIVAQIARDRGGPRLLFQLLLYPVTDYKANTVSMKENADGYFMTVNFINWFWQHYLNNEEEGKNPLVAPLRATSLGGLPSALIITAEFDPLRDEGEQYAARLQKAGVRATLTRYDGMIHGFISMAALLPQGRKAIAESVIALKAAFNTAFIPSTIELFEQSSSFAG